MRRRLDRLDRPASRVSGKDAARLYFTGKGKYWTFSIISLSSVPPVR